MIQVEPQVILTSATASFNFTYKPYKAMSDVTSPSHTCTYTCTYTHTHKQLCRWDFFGRSYEVALLPGPCSAFHHFQYIYCEKQNAVWEQQFFIKYKSTELYCYIMQIKISNLELSDVSCRLSNKATVEKEWTPNRVILIFSPSPTHKLYRIKKKGVEIN